MEKVTYKELQSAVVSMDNSIDTLREFEISANVNIMAKGETGAITDGVVRAKGTTTENLATFNFWRDTNRDIRYVGNCDECAVIEAIKAFVANIKTKVADGGIESALQ